MGGGIPVTEMCSGSEAGSYLRLVDSCITQRKAQGPFSAVIDSGLVDSTDFSGRGTARAEDAQGTPTQSHISPSILVYEDKG